MNAMCSRTGRTRRPQWRLENDGLGDLARDVHMANPDGGAAGVARPVKRREGFNALRIALPRVLVAEKGQPLHELDAESDLLPLVDWSAFDVAALADRLPKEALRLRRKGSNPCRGMPRYWQAPKERYLTPAEYLRLFCVDVETDFPQLPNKIL